MKKLWPGYSADQIIRMIEVRDKLGPELLDKPMIEWPHPLRLEAYKLFYPVLDLMAQVDGCLTLVEVLRQPRPAHAKDPEGIDGWDRWIKTRGLYRLDRMN